MIRDGSFSSGIFRSGPALSVAVLLGLAFSTHAARAQTPPPPSAAASSVPSLSSPPGLSAERQAELLFEEGFTLLAAEKFDLACAKFKESQRLDPAPGTVYNIATCEHGQGLFATAARRWKECATQLAAGDPLRQEAQSRAAQAEKLAGRLTLRLDPPPPEGTVVSIDGRQIGAEELKAVILVDPGSHHIVIAAPGRSVREISTTVATGETREIVAALGPVGRSLPPAPQPSPRSQPTTERPPPSGGFFVRHTASMATLGVAVGAAAAGLGLALDMVDGRFERFVQKCGSSTGCSQADVDALVTHQTATNILLGVAGSAGLAAVGLFIFAERPASAPSATRVALTAGLTGVSLTVRR